MTDVSVRVQTGEAVCIIGPNGAGKSTLARILAGLTPPREGNVRFEGQPLEGAAYRMVRRGIAIVLEGRHLFSDQSVLTNLQLGAYAASLDRQAMNERIERVFSLFPALESRSGQLAATLSGGEQQMVAVGRALMAEPRLLILDEPSMGLAPKIAGQVFEALARLRDSGLSILLVEQNATLAFQLATRAYLLRQGHVVLQDRVAAIRDSELVRRIYLGESAMEATPSEVGGE